MEELEERDREEQRERNKEGEEVKERERDREGEEEEEKEKEERKKKKKERKKEKKKERRKKKDAEEKDIEPRLKVRCPLSHPAQPHNLFIRIGKAIQSGCYTCAMQEYRTRFYYHCTTCDVDFHDGCHLRPKKMLHPYHLQHPLTFTLLNTATEINNNIQTQSPLVFDRCSWCGNNPETWVYSCSICGFFLDLPCSQKNPLLTIANPKSHHHSLFFLTRPLLAPCDACGMVSASEASYTCFQCNYTVHENCINLPRIIKLTRHPHRLFFTPYLPPTIFLPCRICNRAVDTRFGQYSCKHDEGDCSYVIHSICATHGEVWDGRELEWEPEEAEEIEDVASFTKVGDDLIEYFCHDHYLKLEKYDGVRDAKKQCEACILPIDYRCFYNCTQCDYALHQVCAGLPRKLDHVLHKHRLFLDPTPRDDYEDMTCSACFRKSNGFRYKCVEEYCVIRGCHVDLRCILIPHYFSHKSHDHPVFSSVSYGRDQWTSCWICKKGCGPARLHCTQCEFAMCYRCATIPTELHYKHDEHPLSLCYGETTDDVGIYWCELCEQKIDSQKWFYTCNKCCTTIHRECIFGSSIYMKSGSTFFHNGFQVKIMSNNSVTRLICVVCQDRCSYSVCYSLPQEYGWLEKAICSFRCLQMFIIYPEDM
ncbi:Protein VACUOLELESS GAMETOPHYTES [Cardamine amara subsp. amara]|uniref:Protein VACUOLELESS GAMETOPHYTES n=1 Tax=Cardamine amara subsp. amara TaxID=228776 RepID=A0ABD1AYN7_CARAN